MEILNLEEKKAERIVFSEDGVLIEPGETYYTGVSRGHQTNLTIEQGEKFLGLREFDTAKRKELAKKGHAMSDGSYPIENCSDAANAIRAQGRGQTKSSQAKVVAHIKRRVKALGCKGAIFENYK